MKPITLLAFGAPFAYALPELSISKVDTRGTAAANAVRRDGSPRQPRTVDTNVFDVLKWSRGGAYYANITVGTAPPQVQTVVLDTGSSDLYLDASDAWACRLSPDNDLPCRGGTFDRFNSTTYKELSANGSFYTRYGDDTTVSGFFGADVVGIGSTSIANVQFGLAESINTGTSPTGLLGLGYTVNEASQFINGTIYPNLIDSMVDAGVIESRLYSVYLGKQSDISGSILFGGIDTSRYDGSLTTLNLLPENGSTDGVIYEFMTTITGAEVTAEGQTTTLWENGPDGIEAYVGNASQPVLLDTGSTDWYVSQEVYDKIIATSFSFVNGEGYCNCSKVDPEASFHLTFGGKAQIQVPASQLFAPVISPFTGEPLSFKGSEDALCTFLISPSNAPWVVGDAVLRSMYIVFDLDNGQVSIAQASTDLGRPANIIEVKAGPNGVANAVSGVVTAPPNTWSVLPAPIGTLTISATSLDIPIGTATGLAAIPLGGQANGTVSFVGGSVQSTFVTSTTKPSLTNSASVSTTSPPQGGRVCPKDGALVCNGPNEFGLCNFGQVVWQPVAPGTACKNDGIIGVGIYAIPE